MANPWMKKNPFLSMWLSGANAVAGSMRGRAIREARRQSTTAMRTASKAIFDAWTSPWTLGATKRKKRTRR